VGKGFKEKRWKGGRMKDEEGMERVCGLQVVFWAGSVALAANCRECPLFLGELGLQGVLAANVLRWGIRFGNV
jgi:hypothetical protein